MTRFPGAEEEKLRSISLIKFLGEELPQLVELELGSGEVKTYEFEGDLAELCAAGAREEVIAFASLMEQKLAANDDKGGWKDCRPEYLLMRLLEEIGEFEDSLRRNLMWDARISHLALTDDCDPDQVRGEAADVANFAMMLLDALGILKGEREEQEL